MHEVKEKTSVDLIKKAASLDSRSVRVVFKKITLADFPKSTHNTKPVKEAVGTQKVEVFDVVKESDDIIHLVKNPKDLESIEYVVATKKEKMTKETHSIAEYKFVDFAQSVIDRADKSEQSQAWFNKLRELDGKIHSSGLSDKINFSDERLVTAAYNILVKSDVFDESATLREWLILKQYCETELPPQIEHRDEILKLIDAHINNDANKEAEIEQYADILRDEVFEEDYIFQFPSFFLNVLEKKKATKEKKDSFVKYDFKKEADQLRGMRDVAQIMLEDTSEMTVDEVAWW